MDKNDLTIGDLLYNPLGDVAMVKSISEDGVVMIADLSDLSEERQMRWYHSWSLSPSTAQAPSKVKSVLLVLFIVPIVFIALLTIFIFLFGDDK